MRIRSPGTRRPAARARRAIDRLWGRFDLNADVGGFVSRDRLWWYGSARREEVSALAVNFPVRPRDTSIVNYTGKITYRVAPQHRLVAYAQTGRNHQPNRLEPFVPTGGILNATTAIHLSDASTVDQLATGHLWKAEWNATAGDTLFLDVRGGQFDTTRRERPHAASPRFEDIGNQRVRGGSRDSQQAQRQDQVFGSLSWFKDGWFGNHRLNVGGEIIRVAASESWNHGYPGDVTARPAERRAAAGLPVRDAVALGERPLVVRSLRRRHLADRPAIDAEPRSPVRPRSRFFAGAGASARRLQPDTADVRGRGQRDRLE